MSRALPALHDFLLRWAEESGSPEAEVARAQSELTGLRPYLLDWLRDRGELDTALARVLFVVAAWVPASSRLAAHPSVQSALAERLEPEQARELAAASLAKLELNARLYAADAPAPTEKDRARWFAAVARWPRCLEPLFWLDLEPAASLALAESLGGSPYSSPDRADLPEGEP